MLSGLHRNTVVVFAGLGLASGLASAAIGIEHPRDGLQTIANLFGMHASLLPVGLCFAAAMALAAWLAVLQMRAPVIVWLATLYGWSGAVHIAIRLQRNVGDDAHLLAACLAAGAFGAAAVHSGFAASVPELRAWRKLGAVCVVGAAAGLVFFAGERGVIDKRALFIVWQTAVAFMIGWWMRSRPRQP